MENGKRYALMASRTLWGSCQRLERYFAIVSVSVVLRANRADDRFAQVQRT